MGTNAVGFDLDPVADRIRVHTSGNLNLGLDPETGQLAARDPDLTYAAGDRNVGANPEVVATAYSGNLPGATATTLYAIDSSRRALVRQDPASGGALTTVAPLTLGGAPVGRVVGPVSFDIAGSGVAYVTFRLGGQRASQLFIVDLASGRLRALGAVGPPLPQIATQGLAAVGRVANDKRSPDVVISAPGSQRLVNVVRRGPARSSRAQATSSTAASGLMPGCASVPRTSPENPSRVRRAISSSPSLRAGCSSGRCSISRPMRLRSCSAKCGVEAPMSWRTSSTVTAWRGSLRAGSSASLTGSRRGSSRP